MSKVGLRKLHYAILISDTSAGVSYDAPVALPNVISIDRKVAATSDTLYADNGPAEINDALGAITLTINRIELSLAEQAVLLGHSIVGGVMVSNIDDMAPYIALMFEGTKTNGTKRYKKILKGKAMVPDESYKTKGEKPEPQTDTIVINCVRRDYDSNWEKTADEEHPDYVASIGANWYTAVESTGDAVVPTVACVPADAAVDVAANASVVLTFSEAMTASSLVVGESFILQKADGTQVVGTGTWNTGHTVYTFVPTTALTAAASYDVIVTKAVKDLANNSLAAVNVFNFTVAA